MPVGATLTAFIIPPPSPIRQGWGIFLVYNPVELWYNIPHRRGGQLRKEVIV